MNIGVDRVVIEELDKVLNKINDTMEDAFEEKITASRLLNSRVSKLEDDFGTPTTSVILV